MRNAIDACVTHAGDMEHAYAELGEERRRKSHTSFDEAMYPPTDPNDFV
jgi:hypothetical protein